MKSTEDILATNKKQKDFYNDIKQNLFTRVWAGFRNGVLNKIRKNIGVHDQAYVLHKQWFGDLSQKKVLDLGCFSGNYLSLYLAGHSKSYLGIDLSDVAIDKLKERLLPFANADAKAVDFLSEDFTDTDFDLIYAYGVLHHFENTDMLIHRLKEKLTTEGTIISYDPLQTSLPIKMLRAVYRPFQSDAEWEWPFSKKTFRKFNNAFDVVERRGILGKSKWIALINMLPIGAARKRDIGRKWHTYDWEQSNVSDKALFSCMHLTMLMKNKN